MTLQQAFENTKHGMMRIQYGALGHIELLTKVYHEIYVPAFPIEDERAPLHLWLRRLNPNSNAPVKYAIILSGKDLASLDVKSVTGISVGVYYKESRTGYLTYNAVRPECQRQGLGRSFVYERIEALKGIAADQGQDLQGVFLDINDPAKVKPEEDTMDPAIRMARFKKWGAREVPIDFIQPAFEEGGKGYDKLKLLYYPVFPDVHPSANVVCDFIRSAYDAVGADPERNEDFKHMTSTLLGICQSAGINGDAPLNLLDECMVSVSNPVFEANLK